MSHALLLISLAVLVTAGHACRTQGEGCAGHIPCCAGLRCAIDAGQFWGFCQPGSGGGGGEQPPTQPPQPPSGGYLISLQEFRTAVTSNGYPSPSEEQYNNINSRAAGSGSITTKRELAMFLANILHESDGLRAKEEYNPINAPYAPYPGRNYHGRGYIMLSHYYNYRDASQALYGDLRLLENPDLVKNDDRIAWDAAFWFWKSRVHSQAGIYEGHFGVSIKFINGGIECVPGGTPQARRRFEMYKKIFQTFSLPGSPIERGCYN
ncbi:uncharacterized protein LOC129596376 [Paramacrobiotus metropolitanus]|uniref:uncharacterized protein LOC129596376 n=1 Tax=Paramacrobiotus metropolitanus TaxID=2943436 RepID=UPI0024459E06|nr:uncharacterized protein LOC129596376 [Paramacrobiotus metropolitanus]